MEYKNFKIVYRKYASLYFIIGIDSTEVCVYMVYMKGEVKFDYF